MAATLLTAYSTCQSERFSCRLEQHNAWNILWIPTCVRSRRKEILDGLLAVAGHYDLFGEVVLLERAQGQFYVVRIIFD
jgi:hypothetical protein